MWTFVGHPETCVYPDVCLGIDNVSGEPPCPGAPPSSSSQGICWASWADLLCVSTRLGASRRLMIFHRILGGRRESLVWKPASPYQGSGNPGNCIGAVFCPDQVLLSRISIRDLVADRKSLVRNSGAGGGGQNQTLFFW